MLMSNQKQFGVWMDTHQAAVVGSSNTDGGPLTVLAHVTGDSNNSKFFKEIASHLLNATHVHITGTGQVQEQFIHYLADTPEFRNSKTAESTSNKMSDEKLIEYISAKF